MYEYLVRKSVANDHYTIKFVSKCVWLPNKVLLLLQTLKMNANILKWTNKINKHEELWTTDIRTTDTRNFFLGTDEFLISVLDCTAVFKTVVLCTTVLTAAILQVNRCTLSSLRHDVESATGNVVRRDISWAHVCLCLWAQSACYLSHLGSNHPVLRHAEPRAKDCGRKPSFSWW